MPTLPFELLIGSDRADDLRGTNRIDFALGLAGDDVIRLRGGADVAAGGSGDDVILAGGGDDLVDGGAGRDRIEGGGGDDVVRGGRGVDLFVFDPSREGEGRDVVTDFWLGVDRIVLDVAAVLEATPGLAEAVVAGGGDVAAVLAGLDDSDGWLLRANRDGDLVIGHPNGRITLAGVSAEGIESFADIAGALTVDGLGEALTDLGDSTGVPESIAAVVAASGAGFDDHGGDFDILLAAAGAAGLVDALGDREASLTVFAPTDDAFVSLAGRLGFHGGDEGEAFEFIIGALTELGGGDPIPLLTDVLSYHVVDGALTLGELQAQGQVETLLEDATLGVAGRRLIDAEPDLGNARIVAEDIQTGNGVIHAVNQVLLPLDL
jgi:uncharacterized surface protein with fasciclin (FAS1) repeats